MYSSFKTNLPSIIQLAILLLVFIVVFQSLKIIINNTNFNFEDLAINQNTSVKYSNDVNNRKIHCGSPLEQKCLKDYDNHINFELVLLLGNSQLHAINEIKYSDEVVAGLLHKKLYDRNQYLITYSAPNISIQEKYLFLENLLSITNIDSLIIPLVYDDTRENNIRQNYFALISNKVESNLMLNGVGLNILDQKSDFNNLNKDQTSDTSYNTLSESYLENILIENSVIWENRHHLRSSIFNIMYKLRNLVFNINSSSVRKKIPLAYKNNLDALEEILKSAKNNDINLILYLAPIRQDINKPYDPDDYKAFINEISGISKIYNVDFYNLESLVPDEYWGSGSKINFSSEMQYDFMHFKYEGHKLLSNKIYNLLK